MLRTFTAGLAPALLAAALVAPPGAHAGYTGTVGSGTGKLVGAGAGDTLIIDKSGSYLRHNRKAAGDPKFASSLDFDTAVAGEQRVANAAGGGLEILPGSQGAVVLGSPAFPAGTLLAEVAVQVDGDDPSGALTIDDSAGSTPRSISVDPTHVEGVLAQPVTFVNMRLTLKGGSASDAVTIEATSTTTDVFGGAGEDSVEFISVASRLSGGTYNGGAGLDRIDYSGYSFPVAVDLTAGTGTGVGAIEAVSDVTGGQKGDRLTGTPYRNVLSGGAGDDVLDGGIGQDILDGGPGSYDEIDYSARTVRVAARLGGAAGDGTDADGDGLAEEGDQDLGVEVLRGGAGDDLLQGSEKANVLTGNAGTDALAGLAGNDKLEGGTHFDTLLGGEGDDTLDGGTGADTLDGGGGTGDRILYSGRTTRVAVKLDGTANDGADPDSDGTSTAAEERDKDVAVEHVTGGLGDDHLRGSLADNQLRGGRGDDTLAGAGGADVLDGFQGSDTIDYSARAAAVTVTLDGEQNDGAPSEGDQDHSIENVKGGSGDDTLRSVGDRRNTLAGGAGDDLLDGGPGTDTLDGGAGKDTITYEGRTGRVAVNLGGFTGDGADPNSDHVSSPTEEGDVDVSIEAAVGGLAGDTLGGRHHADDDLSGGGGDDLLSGLTGDDRLSGGAGRDVIFAHEGDDEVFGGPGDDAITGDDGDDVLLGGFGNDHFIGGPGSDDLLGEQDTDTISYASATQSVSVSLDGIRNDGAPGELDIDVSVENVRGGPGNDELTAIAATPVVNTLFGGPGNDSLKTDEGTTTEDVLACEDGADLFSADPADKVSETCEGAG